MAGSVNRAMLIGNLARDPEVRTTQDGSKIVNMTVATSETWKDRESGERKEKSEFHRIVIFNDRVADVAEKYLRKGAKVYVEGSLQTRKWSDKDGVDRYSTEVVISRFKGELTMLDTRGGGDAGAGEAAPRAAPQQQQRPAAALNARGRTEYAGAGSDLDSEIPF